MPHTNVLLAMSEALRRAGVRDSKSHMRRQSSTDDIRGSVRAAARMGSGRREPGFWFHETRDSVAGRFMLASGCRFGSRTTEAAAIRTLLPRGASSSHVFAATSATQQHSVCQTDRGRTLSEVQRAGLGTFSYGVGHLIEIEVLDVNDMTLKLSEISEVVVELRDDLGLLNSLPERVVARAMHVASVGRRIA